MEIKRDRHCLFSECVSGVSVSTVFSFDYCKNPDFGPNIESLSCWLLMAVRICWDLSLPRFLWSIGFYISYVEVLWAIKKGKKPQTSGFGVFFVSVVPFFVCFIKAGPVSW